MYGGGRNSKRNKETGEGDQNDLGKPLKVGRGKEYQAIREGGRIRLLGSKGVRSACHLPAKSRGGTYG